MSKTLRQHLATQKAVFIAKASEQLAKTAEVRSNLSPQLEWFYDLLLQAVETRNPEWVNPVIESWVQARTEDRTAESVLLPVLITLKQVAWETGCQSYSNPFEMANALEAVFNHAVIYLSKHEMATLAERTTKQVLAIEQSVTELRHAKARFVAVAAHELKTPLTLVQGYAAILNNEVNEVNLTLTSVMMGIQTGIERLRDIVDAMLDLALIDSSMLELNYQPVWVLSLLQQIHQELLPALRQRRQTLIIKEFIAKEEFLYADPDRLRQVIVNVTQNAIKYTPDQREIIISGRKLPGFLEITVIDSGIGIDPEKQQMLFQPFGQMGDISRHSSGKTKFMGGGPGLGLVIAKGLIEAHGGTIWCESDGFDDVNLPGSTFHIMIPIRKNLDSTFESQPFS